jgi:hypothetical protein
MSEIGREFEREQRAHRRAKQTGPTVGGEDAVSLFRSEGDEIEKDDRGPVGSSAGRADLDAPALGVDRMNLYRAVLGPRAHRIVIQREGEPIPTTLAWADAATDAEHIAEALNGYEGAVEALRAILAIGEADADREVQVFDIVEIACKALSARGGQ